MGSPEGRHRRGGSWTTSCRATSAWWRWARRPPRMPAKKFGDCRDAPILRRGSSPMHASTQPSRLRLFTSSHIRAELAHPPPAPAHAWKLMRRRPGRTGNTETRGRRGRTELC